GSPLRCFLGRGGIDAEIRLGGLQLSGGRHQSSLNGGGQYLRPAVGGHVEAVAVLLQPFGHLAALVASRQLAQVVTGQEQAHAAAASLAGGVDRSNSWATTRERSQPIRTFKRQAVMGCA